MAVDERIDFVALEDVESFLVELAALTAEYKLKIEAPCGCCGGLHVRPVAEKDKVGTYVTQRERDEVNQKERVYAIEFETAEPKEP
jgi:hypothetical protein